VGSRCTAGFVGRDLSAARKSRLTIPAFDWLAPDHPIHQPVASVLHPVFGREATAMRIGSSRLPQTTFTAISRKEILEKGIGAPHPGRLLGVVLSWFSAWAGVCHFDTISSIHLRTVFIVVILLIRNLASGRSERRSFLLVSAYIE